MQTPITSDRIPASPSTLWGSQPQDDVQILHCNGIDRKAVAKALREGWLWSKQQPIGNFGGFKSRNFFLRSAAYAQ